MKLNKLSLSLAITLALGSTFGMAHAETTTTTKTPVVTNAKASTHTTTAAKTTAKTTHAKTTAVKTDSTAAAKTTPAATAKSTATTDKTTTTAKTTQKSETPAKVKENLPAGVYPDTKDNWARDAIQAMTEAGYLSGYADNTFRPGKSITREQAAAIYGKVLQHNMNEQELADLVTKENGVSYSDVESDRWSNTAIKLVGAAGVMEGTTKTTFAPAKAMDREEFVASAANLVKKIKPDAPVKSEKVTFKDSASISKAYVADIEYMAQRGYVASGATTDFNPTQPVTRAQAATILNRILNGETAPTTSKATAIKEDAKQDAEKVENKAKTVEKEVAKDVKTDAKKVDTTAKADVKKANAAVKSDAKKVDADAKKVEKEAKAKKSDKVSESKTEQSPRIVRPVRRSTLKPLDQKQQETLENNVFTQLNKTYKTPEAFQDYGVMYWRDNQLHVALKSSSDLDTVKANLASQGNATINNYVVVEPSQYSQTEYDVIESNFRNYYSKNEKGGNIIAVFPDVENNQLYAVVSTASRETQQGIS
ncbi:S-layer homology domain-containing protein, partial [Veillonella sp.]